MFSEGVPPRRRPGPGGPPAEGASVDIRTLWRFYVPEPAIDTEAKLDLSDVEPRVGQLVGGGQRWDPLLRRPTSAAGSWRWTTRTRSTGTTSSRSLEVRRHRCAAVVRRLHGLSARRAAGLCRHDPGSHLIFGGEEWWFYGPRLRPGDLLLQQRRFHDYKVTDTKFAGPTLFQRGDTLHRNQHGTLVAKERSTSIRYLAAEAEQAARCTHQLPREARAGRRRSWPRSTKVRHDWILSGRWGARRLRRSVGDRLPRRVIGPHTIASFTTEYRAFV